MFSSCFPPSSPPTPSYSTVGINLEWVPSCATTLKSNSFSLKDTQAQEFLQENAEKIQTINRLVITNYWEGEGATTSKIAYMYDGYTSSFKIPSLAAVLVIQEARMEPAETIVKRAFTKFNNQNPSPVQNYTERASQRSSSLDSWES